MKKLQILMPMGGLGSRFSKAGFKIPKPLIQIDDIPMFRKAISSVDGLECDKEYIFVIRQEHVDRLSLDRQILDALPCAKVVVIPELTRGAAETALAAQELLDPEASLIIMDCDLWFNSEIYESLVGESLEAKSDVAGVLLTFPSNNPRYSYAQIDENGFVTKTAEKVVISENAITGAYFFDTSTVFINAATKLLQKPITHDAPEYYLSNVYNVILDTGDKVKIAPVDKFASFGTPEELEAYENATN